MSTPLRDDDPVHVLPEDGDVVVPLVESRGVTSTSITLPLLRNSVADTVTSNLFTDDRDGPDYSKAD